MPDWQEALAQLFEKCQGKGKGNGAPTTQTLGGKGGPQGGVSGVGGSGGGRLQQVC